MRGFLFLLLMVALPCELLAQPAAANRSDAQGRKQGEWVKLWPNGRVRYQGSFKDDKPVGEFRHYDEAGRLATVQRHAPDGKSSRAEHFHPSGTLMATGKYLGQAKDSLWSYFDTQGRLRKVERYRAGTLDGVQEAYYANGKLAEQQTYRAGTLHGPSKGWFDNGNLRTECTYAQDRPEGHMVFYFPSGKKEIEGTLVNGDRDGTWHYFNPDGSLQLQMLYRQGVLVKERKENGLFKEYYDDEQLMSEVRYEKGKRQGPFVEYHPNGKWVTRAMPADPVMGTPPDMERVLQGQTKKREGRYVDDQLDGEVKEYDEKGKLVKVTRYVAGVEQTGR